MTGPLKKQDGQVTFTRRQIEWLEKSFPEVAGTPTTSDAELRFRSGQRSVIAMLRTRIADAQENYGTVE